MPIRTGPVLVPVVAAILLVAACAPRPPDGVTTSSSQARATSGFLQTTGSPWSAPPTSSAAGPSSITSPPSPPCSTASVLRTWRLSRLVGQLVVVPAAESDVGAVAPEISAGVGGVLLFGSVAPADLAARIASAGAGAPGRIAPLIMTDEEGGSVERMANLVGSIPSARQLAATMTPAQIRRLAAGLGRRMRANGVGMDLAPVLDLDARAGPGDTDPIGTRSFSASVATTTAAGRAFAAGLEQGGVVPVLKHFPGIGSAAGNSDLGAAVDPTWSVVEGRDLTPFRSVIRTGTPAIMVSNVRVPGLTGMLPASLSAAAITTVLRGRLGFRGLVVTDSLSAEAISAAGYSVPAAAVAAIGAGADLVIYNSLPTSTAALTASVISELARAVQLGRLPLSRVIDAATHVLTVKGTSLCR